MPTASPDWARDPLLNWLARAELALARWLAVVCVLGAVATGLAALGPRGGRGHPMFGIMIAVVLVPFPPALWLASQGVRRAWPYGWALQVLPVAAWVLVRRAFT